MSIWDDEPQRYDIKFDYGRKQREEEERRLAKAYREQESAQQRDYQNSRYNYSNNTNSASRPKDDGYIRYTFSMPATPGRSGLRILISIISAVVFSGIFGLIFGIFGYIGGAVLGWFFGGIIGKNLIVTLVIFGVLGVGLYMARASIVPLFSSIIIKVKPQSDTIQAVPQSENTITVINDVNFRIEPSKDGAIIKTLHQGDTLTTTGIVSGGWTQVKHNGDTGWVSSEYVK
jgi:hypothetical protein